MSTRERLNTVLLGALIAVATVAVYLGLHNASRINDSAQVTCSVQARGLSAQPYLTKAMGDIATLVTPKPGQKIPPSEKATYAVIGDLRANLASYVQIEDQQPKHRDCASP